MNSNLKYFIIGVSHILPDSIYLKLIYKALTGKRLNLKRPVTFNDKLNWLKLHDRKEIYTRMVDKSTASIIAAETIGTQYVPKQLGLYKTYDDIDFSKLPDRFVLKCTHDGGSVCVCKSKKSFDYMAAKRKLEAHLKRNAFYYAREWPYKNVKPQIIAEEFLADGVNDVLPVYKIFCFSGEPKIIQVIHNDKQPNETVDYFDVDWNWLDMQQNYPKSNNPCDRPIALDMMLEMARKLSYGIPHIRIDFYDIEGKPMFSEFTFYNDAGICLFKPDRWDDILGDWIDITNISNSMNHLTE